jgi:hypothetical protein
MDRRNRWRFSIERRLWAPSQTGEIRVFTLLSWPVTFAGLPLGPALFFVALFLLTCFFALSFRESDFAWSSDDALLSGATCPCTTLTTRRRHVF